MLNRVIHLLLLIILAKELPFMPNNLLRMPDFQAVIATVQQTLSTLKIINR